MENPYYEIPATDFHKMTQGRVFINPSTQSVRIEHSEIRFPINLTQILNSNPGVYIRDLLLSDCIFHETLELGDYQRAGRVVLTNCTFHADVVIATTHNVVIAEGCHFYRKLTIQDVSRDSEVGNFSVDGELVIHGGNQALKVSNINRTVQSQILRIYGDVKTVSVTGCFFKGIYCKSTTSAKHTIGVHGCHADQIGFTAVLEQCEMVVNESEVKKITCSAEGKNKYTVAISYCKTLEEITFRTEMIHKAEIRYCEIEKLQIWESLEKSDVLIIEHSTIKQLLFWRFINEGLVALRDVAVSEGGTLGINSSNLGKTEFINCDFGKATLQFENSRLTEVFLAETDFPKKVVLDKKKNHRQAQLAFGQLRTAFDKQGDTVRALEYQAREIEAHYYDIPSYWRRKFPFIHFTKLNLGLNKLSNNFGRDWGRGIIFSIGIGLLCFVTLVWTTPNYSLHGHWCFDNRLIASFARFMNPLRFFDLETLFTQNSKIPYVCLTWGSYVMDFIGRVLVAYGYYQTIQAFRRYGRK